MVSPRAGARPQVNSQIKPLSDDDIIAARVRAAEGGVSWDRAKAVGEALERAAVKREAKRQKRNRVLIAALGLLLAMLACLGWLLTRR